MQTDKKLYYKNEFHDACAIGCIAEISGIPGRRVLINSITALKNMSHRGGESADEKSGDGSGLLFDIPKSFFQEIIINKLNYSLEDKNGFGIAMVFTTEDEVDFVESRIRCLQGKLNLNYLGKREVPVNKSVLGELSFSTCPEIYQFFVTDKNNADLTFERRLYILRKLIENDFSQKNLNSFICSCSSRTIVYKGLLKPDQLSVFYKDLNDENFKIKFALFHDRFSTNTNSSWAMAQPFRMLAHNGEINTIKGNRLWMKAREKSIHPEIWENYIDRMKPIVSQFGSDSFSLDNFLEFLVQSGRSVFESIMMIIPDPYRNNDEINDDLKDFFRFFENYIEPWDGPAALLFTDGKYLGAKLDRNGLRPLRYTITKDDLLIMASEAGVIDVEDENIVIHHHMKTGDYFGMSLEGKGIIPNHEIIEMVSRNGYYSDQLKNQLIEIKRGTPQEEFEEFKPPANGFDVRLRKVFGIDKDDIEKFILPMSRSSNLSVGAMGDDTPQAFISDKGGKLYDYFKQAFAQVTNPPIDPIREKNVMNLSEFIGNEASLLSENEFFNGAIRIESPVLSSNEVKLLKNCFDQFKYQEVKCLFDEGEDIEEKLKEICLKCEEVINEGSRLIFLSDEGINEKKLPIPMLLAVSAVHQHLVEKSIRNRAALICFTGDAVDEHHIASLIAFGASAVYPYSAYEIINENCDDTNFEIPMNNYRDAVEKGLMKIMAKMGISTLTSYRGSMLFHSIGLASDVKKYFPGIKNMFGVLNLDLLKYQIVERKKSAFDQKPIPENFGKFSYRKNGVLHSFNPQRTKQIQKIAKGEIVKTDNKIDKVFLRDLFSVRIEEGLEPSYSEKQEEIIKRFGFGAISLGAISDETHRTLARVGKKLGMRSNTGEGGEQRDRFSITSPNQNENCYVKQVASGRFGVSTDYLAAAREIQIKMAQGAKPGEGGQLPGHKVTLEISNARYTSPGVSLISPPPHHDIYSIEDLAQLIYDLKQVNSRALISVKLVAQFGIGIIACGVVKAGADIILISGGDGGTGASPLSSVKYTGMPWEIGLNEVHFELLKNNLRNRVTLRVDGNIKNSDDIIKAAILGAEEFDFGTSALIALGCIMCRGCHLNTCPVGIATQDEKYRKKFHGTDEGLTNFVTIIAKEISEKIRKAGFSRFSDLIGRSDLLETKIELNEENKIVASEFLTHLKICRKNSNNLFESNKLKAVVDKNIKHLDESIIEEVRNVITTHDRAVISRTIRNTDRTVGARLSGLISFLYGSEGFKGNIQCQFTGSAGQSFGAFLTNNIELRLCGVANDYVGKGMSGGIISIRFPKTIRRDLEGNTIAGNVILFGATGGEFYCSGKTGERFAVRNSGASAVVEGVGNNCCEYMTRGVILILGDIGRNFGAGMTGGSAFVYNLNDDKLQSKINSDSVYITQINESDELLIRKMLKNHIFHTGSAAGKTLLDKWVLEKYNFSKIIPLESGEIDINKIFQNSYESREEQIFK